MIGTRKMNVEICKKCNKPVFFIYKKEKEYFDPTCSYIEEKQLVFCGKVTGAMYGTVYCMQKNLRKPLWYKLYNFQKDYFKWFKTFRINRLFKRMKPSKECPFYIEHQLCDWNKQ